MTERRGTKALEAWCRRITQGYPGVKVENMTTSWRDGLAFCALIHHFRPDLIDFGSLEKSDVIGNNELAFSTAERHLGIPALLDAEDMAEYPVPDRLSILTYLSQFYQVFSTHSSSPGKKTASPDSSISTLGDVPSSPNLEGTPPWRELCVVCNNPVFLAQRLRVRGNLYHRTCFRCARCSAQLTLVDYYETHDGKFCCETCPDEMSTDVVQSDNPSSAIPQLSPELSPRWSPQPRPPPELSPTTRQSIVAMRRMFFDTDDAKLNRCETLATDLPPADIPNSPNDKVKFPIVNSLLVDKLSDSLNTSVEYQSDNVSPSPKLRRLDNKSTASTLNDLSAEMNISTPCDSPIVKSNLEPFLTLDDSDKLNNVSALVEKMQPICDIPDSLDKVDDLPVDDSTSQIIEGEINITSPCTDSKIPEEIECKPESELTEEIKSDLNFPVIKITTEFQADDSKTSESNSLETSHAELADSNNEKGIELVEAINENVVIPPVRPKRRFRSPQATPRNGPPEAPNEEYPEYLNPFGDDDNDVVAESPTKQQVSTNPFGSDSDEEDSTVVTSTPITSPMKTTPKWTPSASPLSDSRSSHFTPMKKAPSLNPFGDSDEEDSDTSAIPVPLPRSSQIYPEPMPFPRSSLRASLRSIDSAVSTSSRKKRPAPPPPTPPSPASTIRSIRSRKNRRAPLPPGMTSSRLSLASDNVSLYGDTRDSNVPEQISAVADRITEWVETSQIDSSNAISNSEANEDVTSERLADSTEASNEASLCDIDRSRMDESIDRKSLTFRSIDRKSPSLQLIESERSIEVSKADIKDDSPAESVPDNKERSCVDSEISNETKLRSDEIEIEDENSIKKEKKMDEKPLTVKSEIIESPDKSIQTSSPLEPYVSVANRKSGTSDSDCDDRLSNDKKNKNDLNMTRKISGGSTGSGSIGSYNLHKSAHGQWRRKKAPAPPLPLNPEQRQIKKDFPIVRIKQELNDIEIKQQGLERQGVELEARIRAKFDGDASITPYVEDLVLQLFELVNEKNELFRKQAELMYLRRQQHLEEEQTELEKEIRDLMSQPEVNKTDSDKELEEQLIQRLVEVVERRDAIVQCLEMDRIREAEEDRSISAQLNVFTKAMAPDEKSTTSPKKNKLSPDRHKKKWYTLSRSPKKSPS